MADTLGAFAIMLMMGFLVVVLIKNRAEILNWLSKPPEKRAKNKEMMDFETLTTLGLPEDEAIKRIRDYRIRTKEIHEAITREEEKPTPNK